LLIGASLVVPTLTARADDRNYDRRVQVEPRGWVPLVAMDIQRKETVDIGRRAGRFSRLRIQALRGVAYVDFVYVRFGNGETQHYDIKRRIGREEVVDIDLPGRRYVDAITVHGTPDRWSRIQIVGQR
jgi:hypothetical protein